MAAADIEQFILDTDFGEVNDKGCIADEVRNTIFRRLRSATSNRTCIDCNTRNPTWISLNHGAYVCLECSGEHRRKGVHITFVRSADMDSFSPEQIILMAIGGNQRAREYFKNHGMGKEVTGKPPDYTSKAAARYRALLQKDCAALCAKKGIKAQEPKETKDPPAQPQQSSPTNAADAKAGGYASQAVPTAATSSASKDAAKAPSPKMSQAKPPVLTPAGPQTVIIKKGPPPPATKPTVTTVSPSVGGAPAAAPAKAKGKEIDFDFDFDDLEKEAAKPPPKAPEPVAAPQKTVTEPARTSPTASAGYQGAQQPSMDRFNNSKGISSDDFFGGSQETAQERMDREMRYNKFQNSGAISSDAFFDDGSGPKNQQRGASMKDYASVGIDKLKTGIGNYLSKGQA